MTQNKIIVTIGRQFGSGGHEVGRRLASELGISFYDHEFVDMAVKKTGFHADYVKDNEEKVRISFPAPCSPEWKCISHLHTTAFRPRSTS